MSLPSYVVYFRGYPACPCLAQWLPVYERYRWYRKSLVGPLRIYQLIGNASASGNTHSRGGAFDITDDLTEADVRAARDMGADATWERTAAQGFVPHIHGVLSGCVHNGPARYQIDAVKAGYNGLGAGGRGGPDDGPRPLSGRTWREGIKWAESEMATYEDWSQEEKDAEAKAAAQALLKTKIKVKNAKGESVEKTFEQITAEVYNNRKN